MEARIRIIVRSLRPVEEIRRAIDPLLERLGERAGAYQAQLCIEAATGLRQRKDGLAIAEHYAHRAVAYADAHDVLRYGDHGQLAARAASRRALAEAQFALGKNDSAYVLLRGAIEMVPEFDEFALQRDLRASLGAFLEAGGRDEEAIAALFESVALDTNQDSPVARRALHRLWQRRFGDDSDLDARIDRARGRKWAGAMGGGVLTPKGCPAPQWSLPDLAGAVTRSSAFAGRPTVVVFWGGWTGPNRAILRMAEDWHRRRIALGVEVVSMNWELPGPGPISAGLAREIIARHGYCLPVMLDHDQVVFEGFPAEAEAYPQIFLIDRGGYVRRTVFGGVAASMDSLTIWVEALGKTGRQ